MKRADFQEKKSPWFRKLGWSRKRIVLSGLPRPQPTALITGGAGFIGSNLGRHLLEEGYTVYAVDNFITGQPKNIEELRQFELFHFLPLDITSREFKKKFQALPIHYVFHLACPTGVPNIQKLAQEILLTNSLGTWQVLEVARQHNAKVLFTSSCEVYGQAQVSPQTENYNGNVSPLGPRSPYEEGKRFSESLIATYVNQHHLDARIVRIFNAYGPGMSTHDQRVIPQFMNAISAGEPLRIYGTGEQTRTFAYIDDIVRGLILAVEKGQAGEAYNLGDDKPVSIKSLAHEVIRLANSTTNIIYRPHFTEDHSSRRPAISKIEQLGWNQSISLEEGLERTLAAWGILDRAWPAEKSPVIKEEAIAAPLG